MDIVWFGLASRNYLEYDIENLPYSVLVFDEGALGLKYTLYDFHCVTCFFKVQATPACLVTSRSRKTDIGRPAASVRIADARLLKCCLTGLVHYHKIG